jgi:excisionase family DNA binding protein
LTAGELLRADHEWEQLITIAFSEDAMPETHEQRIGGPTLLLVSEVAALLRTSPKAVYAMVERGLLPGVVRIGRRVLIQRDDLLHWLSQKSAPSLER